MAEHFGSLSERSPLLNLSLPPPLTLSFFLSIHLFRHSLVLSLNVKINILLFQPPEAVRVSVIQSMAAKFLSPLTQLMTDTLTCTWQHILLHVCTDRELNIGTCGSCMCHVSEWRGESAHVGKKVTDVCTEGVIWRRVKV